MKLTFLILSLFLSLKAGAGETKLATITSDTDSNQAAFYLLTNAQGEIEAMRYLRTLASGQVITDETFNYEEIVHDGAVLFERDGHQVINLLVEKFSRTQGGVIRLNYLVNGVRGTRRDIRLSLQNKHGKFALYDQQGRKVNHMLVQGNHVRFIGLVGISDIIMSYQ